MERDRREGINAALNSGRAQMSMRLNNDEACIVCCRRSDGVAVGDPGSRYKAKRLGWYCFECGPITAWSVVYMDPKNFDVIEQRVALKLAEELGGLEVPADEVPAFIAYIIKEFAEEMRRQVNGKS